MKLIRKILRRVGAVCVSEYCRWLGYEVQVMWDGDVYHHVSATYADAQAWAKAYPAEACATIYQFGAPIAQRRPLNREYVVTFAPIY